MNYRLWIRGGSRSGNYQGGSGFQFCVEAGLCQLIAFVVDVVRLDGLDMFFLEFLVEPLVNYRDRITGSPEFTDQRWDMGSLVYFERD